MIKKLPNHLAQVLPSAAVYAYLIHGGCFWLSVDSAKEIEKHWAMDLDEASRLGIRSVPSLILNLLSSHSCMEKFGVNVLRQVAGFFESDGVWRLDLDERHWRGLILPVHNDVGWITSLKVFRHPLDSHPFTLRVRQELAA